MKYNSNSSFVLNFLRQTICDFRQWVDEIEPISLLKIFSVQTKVRLYVVNPSGLVEFFSALQIMQKPSLLSREREKKSENIFCNI